MKLTKTINVQESYASSLLQKSVEAYKECVNLTQSAFIYSSVGEIKLRSTLVLKILFYAIKAKDTSLFDNWYDSLVEEERQLFTESCKNKIKSYQAYPSQIIPMLDKVSSYKESTRLWNLNWYKNIMT